MAGKAIAVKNTWFGRGGEERVRLKSLVRASKNSSQLLTKAGS